jgi:hypothetical protein
MREKENVFKEYVGKLVYAKLISDRIYTGRVLEVTFLGHDPKGVEIWMFSIRDKFGMVVSFSNKEIKLLEMEREK